MYICIYIYMYVYMYIHTHAALRTARRLTAPQCVLRTSKQDNELTNSISYTCIER